MISFRSKWYSLRSIFDRTVNLFHALAHVTPIFKKGDSCAVSNYRPISLTSVFSKIMESEIRDQMVQYLVTNGIITKHQHGFLSKHSTATQLLDCLQDWSLTIRDRSSGSDWAGGLPGDSRWAGGHQKIRAGSWHR